jgi:hypothetical protein
LEDVNFKTYDLLAFIESLFEKNQLDTRERA